MSESLKVGGNGRITAEGIHILKDGNIVATFGSPNLGAVTLRQSQELCQNVVDAYNSRAEPITVGVYVEGGNVQGCRSNRQDVTILMCDKDNIEAGDEDTTKEYENLEYGIY